MQETTRRQEVGVLEFHGGKIEEHENPLDAVERGRC